MSTTGTFTFQPTLGDLTLYAFNACQIRPSQLDQQHMESARMASNLLLSRWSSQGVNLWTVDLQTIPLVQGQATYDIPANTITMLDTYITVGSGQAETDRIIFPISRSEYANYPNKTQEGFPSVYWFDRLLSPTVTLYQVPDGNEVALKYYRMRQIQDAALNSAQGLEMPVYFYEAFAMGLARRLALIWKPEMATGLKALEDEAYEIATNQNTEQADFYVTPMVSGYYQN